MELNQEIYNMIEDFFKKNPNGICTLCYPTPLWEHNKYGISFTKATFRNHNKMEWKQYGILFYQTLGFSLITGKHLYLPYAKIDKILFEEGEEL
jgi:hypothetical protein